MRVVDHGCESDPQLNEVNNMTCKITLRATNLPRAFLPHQAAITVTIDRILIVIVRAGHVGR